MDIEIGESYAEVWEDYSDDAVYLARIEVAKA
jgi:hypothetical protein